MHSERETVYTNPRGANHIAPPCSHDNTKADELTYVHTGVIWLVNLGTCGHKVNLKVYTTKQWRQFAGVV